MLFRSVLIVDDSMLVVQRIAGMLRELTCIDCVISALNYNEAEKVLANHEVDIALLDINMPGKSGIELLNFMKEKYPCITNIMLTNQSNEYYRNLCLQLGADYFLDKTSEFDRVPELIQSFHCA